jgi:hypothetical protein
MGTPLGIISFSSRKKYGYSIRSYHQYRPMILFQNPR